MVERKKTGLAKARKRVCRFFFSLQRLPSDNNYSTLGLSGSVLTRVATNAYYMINSTNGNKKDKN